MPWPPSGAPATLAAPVADQDRPHRRRVAVRGEHAHARDVLRHHRHDEQRQADAEQRAELKRGRHEGQLRQQMRRWATGDRVDRHRDRRRHQRARHRPAPRDAPQHEPDDDGRDRELGDIDDRVDRLQADRQQDAGHQPAGDRPGDRDDRARQGTPQARDDDQDVCQQERADRSRVATAHRPGGDQQRRARRRPRHGQRHLVVQGERDADDAHGDRQHQQPRRRLGVAGPDRVQSRQDDRERAGEADQRGDDAGDDRL